MDTQTLKVNSKYRELYFDTRGGGKRIVTGEFCEPKVADEIVRRYNTHADLLAALKDIMRHCVTPKGFPEAGKGRTPEQQAAYDTARALIAKAEQP